MFSPSPPPLPDRFKLCGVPRKTMLKEMLTSFKPLVSHEKLVWSVCSIIFFHRLVTGWWFQIFFYFHPYLGKVSILTKIFEMGRNHQPRNCHLSQEFWVMFPCPKNPRSPWATFFTCPWCRVILRLGVPKPHVVSEGDTCQTCP